MYICNTYNFGDRHQFGITFELPQEREMYHGRWLNGAICYWICGRSIGDMQYGATGCDVLILLEDINKRTSYQCGKEIFHADAELILRTMDMDIDHEADDIIQENCFGFVGTSDFWRGFDITLQLDIVREYQILYFEHDGQARLIIAKYKKKKILGYFKVSTC
jgi:hypothetical protein